MSEEILDMEDFLERVQDDKELLLELLDIFTADYEVKKGQLQEAIENKDDEQIRGLAHSLKGSSGNISAKRLREIFLQIEVKAKEKDFEKLNGLLVQMRQEFDSLSQRIGEVKAELA